MGSYNQDEQSLWYGYEIVDGENHLLGDEGDEAYFATKAGIVPNQDIRNYYHDYYDMVVNNRLANSILVNNLFSLV